MTILDKLSNGIQMLWQNLNAFILGKVLSDNASLQKENQKLQKQVKIATRPDLCWDKLIQWLRADV
ncbi:MAG: hypothetical protein E7013_00860 [Alphaproteobacteria bacterium]|nr:hypothetical protein [Alphaproteobacteria bacterium]